MSRRTRSASARRDCPSQRPSTHRCWRRGKRDAGTLRPESSTPDPEVTPATVGVIAVGQMDRSRSIEPLRVEVGATIDEVVDDVRLTRHRRPVNRLVRRTITGVSELWGGIEELAHLRQVVFANGSGYRLPTFGSVVHLRELACEKALHVRVSAIAVHFDRITEPDTCRAAVEEQFQQRRAGSLAPRTTTEWDTRNASG